MSMWFYFIPNGTYVIESIADGYRVNANGSSVNEGSTLIFNGAGYIFFTVIDSKE